MMLPEVRVQRSWFQNWDETDLAYRKCFEGYSLIIIIQSGL